MIWLPILASVLIIAWAAHRQWLYVPPQDQSLAAMLLDTFLGPFVRWGVTGLTILVVWLVWALASPARAQPVQCMPLEAFVVQQVEPVRAAGIPIITLTNQWEVGRYLEVVNRQPPETDFKAEGLIIGVAANVVVVALVEHGHVCSVIQLAIGVHSDALLAAKRGA